MNLPLDAEGSTCDSIGGVDRILGKEGADARFTFKVDAFVGVEGLDEVKHEKLHLFCKIQQGSPF